jgi:hypothetical protein
LLITYFKWSNEGKGVAVAHQVIIGYSTLNKEKTIFNYSDTSGDPYTAKKAKLTTDIWWM